MVLKLHTPRELILNADSWASSLEILIQHHPLKIGPRNSCCYFSHPQSRYCSSIIEPCLVESGNGHRILLNNSPDNSKWIDGEMKSIYLFYLNLRAALGLLGWRSHIEPLLFVTERKVDLGAHSRFSLSLFSPPWVSAGWMWNARSAQLSYATQLTL